MAVLTLVGALAGNLAGRWIVGAADRGIANLPLVRSIYGGVKQVFKQVATPERTSFKQAVLVEFPQPGSWAIGFVTNEDAAEVAHDTGLELVAVYVPQAPIPTSGFLLYLPRSALKPFALPPEDALKRVISLGIIRDAEAEPPRVSGPPTRSCNQRASMLAWDISAPSLPRSRERSRRRWRCGAISCRRE